MPDSAFTGTTSWWTANVRNQVVVTVTSGTAITETEGRMRWDTDTNRLRIYDGTGWIILHEPWQSFTPSWGGVTLGSATNSGRYRRSGGSIEIKARLTLSSTTMTGPLTLTAPVDADAAASLDTLKVVYSDTGSTAASVGHAAGASVSSISLWAINSASTYITTAAISSSVPFTWANTDVIDVHGIYRMTTLYS